MPPSQFLPLPILAVYLGKEFLRFFFFCLALFLGISLLVDFFDHFDTFVKYSASLSAVMRYSLFKAPLLILQAAPAAALAAALLSVGFLSRHRELLALKSCGVSPWQITYPLVLIASVLSFGVGLWNETVVPYAFHKSRHIYTVEIKKKAPKVLFDERGFWYHAENAFYHIDHFDSRRNILFGLIIYRLDKDFQVRSLIEAGLARWQKGHWVLEDVREKPFTQEGASSPPTATSWHLTETPEDFALVDLEAEEFSSRQLQTRIANLQRKGLDTTEYQVDLYLKGAVPIAVLVMTLLGTALAMPGAKQFTFPTTVGFALMAGFGYWVLLALTVSLGQTGVLSPLPATWSANVAACFLGLFFLLGVD